MPNTNVHTILRVIAVAASLAFAPAHAASKQDEPKAEQRDAKAAPKEDSSKPKPQAGFDTESCRQDASGKHGPERARFMTDCLKKR